MFFKNRRDAGRQLSRLLQKYKGEEIVVYALPRGGVPVAAEIASFLHAPLDLIFAHKIGHPYQPEYAIAAISESGHLLKSSREIMSLGEEWLKSEKERQITEIKRKRKIYLKDKPEISLKDKIAIIVDDGIATGLTMQVGITELRDRGPKKIVVAVPVSPKSTADLVGELADEFVGFEIDDHMFLGSVGAYYDEFDQTEDQEVIKILDEQAKSLKDKSEDVEKIIQVPIDKVVLEGMLKIPQSSTGIVLFAHGSGSSRFSPRNNFVADILNKAGLATLLIDLLSKQEDADYETRFDIELLTERLGLVVDWLGKQPETNRLAVGLFGASTGAAAAMQVAALMHTKIRAVVSRGGRADLAGEALNKVTAPTLLIVGGDDYVVIELNEGAFEQLTCFKQLEVIPHAGHLFEEPGCLEEVARLSKAWFNRYL